MENLGFNMFDAVVIGLIVLLSIKGLLSGFTKELFNAIGLIGGLFVASYYKKELATYLHNNFLDSISIPLLELISLLAIFIAIFIVAKLVYKIIESLTNKEHISGASRLGGMLVKMVTLFFVFSLIVLGLSSKPHIVEKFKDTLDSSKLYPLLKDSGFAILNADDLINTDTKTQESTSKEAKEESNTTKETNTTTVETRDEANTTTPASSKEANTTTTAEEEVNSTTAMTKEANTTATTAEEETNTTTSVAKEEANSTTVVTKEEANTTATTSNEETNSTNSVAKEDNTTATTAVEEANSTTTTEEETNSTNKEIKDANSGDSNTTH